MIHVIMAVLWAVSSGYFLLSGDEAWDEGVLDYAFAATAGFISGIHLGIFLGS